MQKLSISLVLCWLGFLYSGYSRAADSEQLQEPDEAFEFHVESENAKKLRLRWDIADGYYLYRQKFKFNSLSAGIKTGAPMFPAGQAKQDKYFGKVEIYRDQLEVELPILRQDAKSTTLMLEATFQGCADIGVCYMPIRKIISLELPEPGITDQDRKD